MLSVRRAIEADCLDILEWRNDPVTRSMFRNQDIVSEADHKRWYANTLARDDRVLFVAEYEATRIGVMRFDKVDAITWEVSHNMAPAARGKGLGQQMVREVLDAFRVPLIVAEIKQDNPSCWHIYEKAGFVLTGTDPTYRHYELRRQDVLQDSMSVASDVD